MAEIIKASTFGDDRGILSVLDNVLPFEIKRVYYIYNASGVRGGHRHKITRQALIALGGSCTVYVHNGVEDKEYHLSNASDCLILEPEDWHTMSDFSEHMTLLVLASEAYDVNDYIDEKYE